MQVEVKPVLAARLEALHNWFQAARPVCFRCKRQLRWNQRRFWEGRKRKRVYFFCDCGFENPLAFLQFKWETEQEFFTRNIKTR
ncbi:MAG: hypothetical protein HWN65_05640 [Candidatus Helarchaeota archaeon]|nr:hypothetical protein [Candidatus Helarchaeota archaeon]